MFSFSRISSVPHGPNGILGNLKNPLKGTSQPAIPSVVEVGSNLRVGAQRTLFDLLDMNEH
jgi:hypothetical protein